MFGSEVSLSICSLTSLLNVPRDSFDKYVGDGWITIIGVIAGEIFKCLFVVPYTKKSSYQSANLCEPIMLVLYSVCNKFMIPIT